VNDVPAEIQLAPAPVATRPRPTRGLIARYLSWLPVADSDPVVTLGEGSTPLVSADVLSEQLGCEVWLKVEGANPTGSFKDRGMTVALSVAAGQGAEAVVCASTGNTSASAAAYAGRAGLTPIVLLPAGRIAGGKMVQAIVHGAVIVQVDGNFDHCLELARALADRYPVALVNSVNPVRIEGQKTAAFEIVDDLGDAPDLHVLPVGNGGNITAYWRGYTQYAAAGIATRTPRMWGFQAAGAAPLVLGHPVTSPETVASAIRIGNPASTDLALAAKRDSGGLIEAVSDDEILAAQRFLAAREGVFVEPASAAGVAGLLAKRARGELDPGQRIVVTVTGNGLKDVDTALAQHSPLQTEVVPPDVQRVALASGLLD
jgi:threonine synthase